ncbi:MAG: hypothetical protein ACM3TR_09415 [Caulobacteraceae bacterium]
MIKNSKSSKTWKIALTIALILSVMSFVLSGCSSGNSSNQAAHSGTNTNNIQSAVTDNTNKSSKDTDGDGIPDEVEKTYGTNPYVADTDGDGINDKADKDPLKTENLIKETSTAPLELKIKDARVEDNATADHLEITMTNTGKTALSNFDIYYTITDKVDKTQESYYQALNGLSINPGETKTIHFDNQVSEFGHYYGNMSGLYGNSKNGLVFDIQLHAKGFKPMEFKVEKAKGTAEVAD